MSTVNKAGSPNGVNLEMSAPAVSVMPAHNLSAVPEIIATAQPDNKGTDFWLAFLLNYTGTPALTLFITGDTDTTGTVSSAGLGFSTPFAVTAGTVTSVVVPSNAMVTATDGVENKGIHVTTESEVTVYGLNRIQFSTDAFLGLPTDILSNEHIVLAYKNSNILNGTEFAVVATQNSTTLTIVPAVATAGHPAGTPYTVVLNQGQVYQLVNDGSAPSDMSGSVVTSDRPIAVFGGHRCANIPQGYTWCDHIVEELPPTNTWGRSFVTVPLATRRNGDTFRFLASTDDTTVSVNGTVVATLNRGQLHEQIIAGAATVTSDKPILVAQYSNGSSWDGVTSDPFMMLIPPYEQFLGGYTVTTPASGFAINYINVVASASAVGTITLDGSAIPAESFAPIGSSGFSGAQVSVAPGSHALAGSLPFGAFIYGFADYDSYGYPGGLSLAPIAVVTQVTLAPKEATNPVGTEHCVTATVTDQQNAPVAGVRVDFNVTGVNPMAGFNETDQDGQTQFCYIGSNLGVDTITASVGTLSDTATKTWGPSNQPPVANSNGPYSVFEGSTVTLDGAGSSDPDNDPLTYAWDLDEDGTYETPGVTPVFSATGLDGPSTHTAGLQVCDPGGLCDTDAAEVQVTNVPPTADAGSDQTVYRNELVAVTGAWVDPGGALDDPYAWTWDLTGDGMVDQSGSAAYGTAIAQTTTFATEGTHTLTFGATDKDGGWDDDTLEVTVLNRPPNCTGAGPSVALIWPPNHQFVPVQVMGVTDPEGDTVSITVSRIWQDEPVDTHGDGRFTPDGLGVGTATAQIRAERAGTPRVPGNGRVYHIYFEGVDGHGGVCTGEVLVTVPHDQNRPPVDDGALYDSTQLAP